MDGHPLLDRWDTIDALFSAALDLPEAEDREAFVRDAAGGDEELLHAVLALLAGSEETEGFLEQPHLLLKQEILWDESEAVPIEGQRVGPYRLLEEIGRGGTGTVYRAERADGAFEQSVAVKLLRRGLDTEDILQRFRAERQILASLNHPNIARLLDGGATDDGRPYLVMELIEGLPITEHCDRHRLSVEDRLRLFRNVAHAVQYAHERQVVHRDLKPNNIMVTEEGVAKLLDFGIAKLLDETAFNALAPLTRTGVRLMTPDYASPEQVRGEPVTTACDVYQLGALLYELLTGERYHDVRRRSGRDQDADERRGEPLPPSAALRPMAPEAMGGGGTDTLERIAAARGCDPATLKRRLRAGLDGIVLQAMRAEPGERYATVAALIEDIQRFRSGTPVRGRALPRLRRMWRSSIPERNAALVAAVAVVLLLGGALLVQQRVTNARSGPPVMLAVGEFSNQAGAEEDDLARAFGDLVATRLSQAGVPVLGSARLAEVLVQLEQRGAPFASSQAAATAGAAELLEGSLHRLADGRLRLHVQRVDLARGAVLSAFTVDSRSTRDAGQELVELVVARILADRGLGAPADGAWVPFSAAAHRFFEEGVRAYYRGDDSMADAYLQAAIREDSTLALASFYLGRITLPQVERSAHFNRALRHAERVSQADRLLIRTAWAEQMFEPEFLALAESLVRATPSDPEAHLQQGNARFLSGEFEDAIRSMRRVVELDSLSFLLAPNRCRGCAAMERMIGSYIRLDSMSAAVRTARRWVALQPESARAWETLAWALWQSDELEGALHARQRATDFRAANPGDAVFPAMVALRAGDFERADRLFEERSRFGPPEFRRDAMWWWMISLRNQGRLREALVVAREHRQMVGGNWAAMNAIAPEAIVMLESGRPREAAAKYDTASHDRWGSEASPNRIAGHNAWTLLHMAHALAAAGDTARLASLADTIQELGGRSLLKRFRVAHYHVRGLLELQRGNREHAVAHFRRAEFSPVEGYARNKVLLAETLLDLERPHEALVVLQPFLRGSMSGPSLHATHSEVHALLGRAWEAAERPESAAFHYRRALDAWRRADPAFHGHRAELQRRYDAFVRPSRGG